MKIFKPELVSIDIDKYDREEMIRESNILEVLDYCTTDYLREVSISTMKKILWTCDLLDIEDYIKQSVDSELKEVEECTEEYLDTLNTVELRAFLRLFSVNILKRTLKNTKWKRNLRWYYCFVILTSAFSFYLNFTLKHQMTFLCGFTCVLDFLLYWSLGRFEYGNFKKTWKNDLIRVGYIHTAMYFIIAIGFNTNNLLLATILGVVASAVFVKDFDRKY